MQTYEKLCQRYKIPIEEFIMMLRDVQKHHLDKLLETYPNGIPKESWSKFKAERTLLLPFPS